MRTQAQVVFGQAVTLEPEARVAFVDEACGGDSQLRGEVMSLLEDANAADAFFERLDEAVFSSPSSEEDPDHDLPARPEFQDGDIVRHYRIVSLIGRGGMGTVFRAHDMRLNRDVALKFLPAHLRAEPDGESRLLIEARAAAALDHPNVCSIHEVGETDDGQLFIAMPCYDGETLKERLRRTKLSVEESLAIAVQIARGLTAAHSRDIVHRDVKPGNVILLFDGSVRLLDFGLATALNESLMSSKSTAGTVGYMSPEQIRGDALDSRTDLWSLGIVLYEMLAGARPFNGGSHPTLIHGILHEQPEPISDRCKGIPSRLAAIVDRLLEKDPAKRYGTAAEVASSLEAELHSLSPVGQRSFFTRRRMFTAASALTILALAGSLGWGSLRQGDEMQSRALRAQPSVAVLQLRNLGADSSDDVFARGMTEELIATLASAGDVRVIASTSVASLKRETMDARQIAKSLGVTNILEGGIQLTPSRVRVQVRLVDGQDGKTLWSESYDRELNEIFSVQDDIARAAAAELELRFDKDRQFVRHHTRNMRAYELYLRGSDPILLRNQSGIWKAQAYFQQAVAADSMYAAAHAGLALAYVRRALIASDPGLPVPRLLDMAGGEARKALTLDPNLAEGHYASGRVRVALLDFSSAEASLRRAIELDPNRSIYRRWLSSLMGWAGRPEEELAEARRALETDPLNPYALSGVASALFDNHRYDEALAALQKLRAMKPPLQAVSFEIAQCYGKKKMWKEAIAMLRPAAEAGDPMTTALLGYMLARAGQRDEANRILASLVARRERTGIGAFHVAVVHAGFDDRDQAFAWLNRSIDDRSINGNIMSPTFEDLHRDPRFGQLRKRLGLRQL